MWIQNIESTFLIHIPLLNDDDAYSTSYLNPHTKNNSLSHSIFFSSKNETKIESHLKCAIECMMYMGISIDIR